jgi:hypothetical protein
MLPVFSTVFKQVYLIKVRFENYMQITDVTRVAEPEAQGAALLRCRNRIIFSFRESESEPHQLAAAPQHTTVCVHV